MFRCYREFPSFNVFLTLLIVIHLQGTRKLDIIRQVRLLYLRDTDSLANTLPPWRLRSLATCEFSHSSLRHISILTDEHFSLSFYKEHTNRETNTYMTLRADLEQKPVIDVFRKNVEECIETGHRILTLARAAADPAIYDHVLRFFNVSTDSSSGRIEMLK